MPIVRKATAYDIQYMAVAMHELDKEELSLGGASPKRALIDSWSLSKDTFVLEDAEFTPFMIYGTAPVEGTTEAIVWAVATPALKKHTRWFLGISRIMMDSWMRDYTKVYNAVWLGNEVHVRFLEHMGFTMLEEITMNNTQYRRFELCVTQAQ